MKSAARALVAASAIATALALSACVQFEKPYPDKRFHVLDVERPGEPGATLGPYDVLRIERPSVSARDAGPELVYRVAELSYQSDFYNELFVPLPDLIAEELREWLSRSGMVGLVVDGSAGLESTLNLRAAVNTFHGDYRDAQAPAAVLGMQFLLLRTTGPGPRLLAARDYARRVPLRGEGADALMLAMNEALAQVFAELENDLRDALAGDR